MNFGGSDVGAGYFSSTGATSDLYVAIASAIDKVLQDMSPNADSCDYSTDSVVGDGSSETHALPTDFLRLLHAYIGQYEITYVRSRDYQSISAYGTANSTMDPSTTIDRWYVTVTGAYYRVYPILTASDTMKVYYVKRCDATMASLSTELAKVPFCYHEAVIAYASWILSKKAKGQWPGDPMIFRQEYTAALMEGDKLSNEGFRDGLYPMQAPNWECEEL